MNRTTLVMIALAVLLLVFVAYSFFGSEKEGLEPKELQPPPVKHAQPPPVEHPKVENQPPPKPQPLQGYPHLIVLDKDSVLNVLEDYVGKTGKKFDVVISINDGRDGKFEDAVKRMSKHPYFFYFLDLSTDHPHGPREDHVKQIRKIAASHRTAEAFLIHCKAGISRSTAAALVVMDGWGVPAQEALTELFRIRPQARPNELMIKFLPKEYSEALAPPEPPQGDIEFVQ